MLLKLAKRHFKTSFLVVADFLKTDLLLFPPAVFLIRLSLFHDKWVSHYYPVTYQSSHVTPIPINALAQLRTAFNHVPFLILSELQSHHHQTECLTKCESSRCQQQHMGSSDNRRTRSCWWSFNSTLVTAWEKFQTGVKLPDSSVFRPSVPINSLSLTPWHGEGLLGDGK